MGKIIIKVPDEMEAALREHSQETGVPISVSVREAIAQWFARKGQKVEHRLNWGGARTPEDDDEQDEAAAMGMH